MKGTQLGHAIGHPLTLQAQTAALVICDLQEAFRPVTVGFDAVVARVVKLVEGMKLLGVPILVTEQSPQKLGRIVSPILEKLPADVKIVDKSAFSCCGASQFTDQLEEARASQIVLCGLETHICVNQTAQDLIARGHQVHLLLDCVTSRTEASRLVGIDKMRLAGVVPCNFEMAMFELMQDAKHEQFKAVQKLVK